MRKRANGMSSLFTTSFLGALLGVALTAPIPCSAAGETAAKHFGSPEEAGKALVAALTTLDKKELRAIFGSAGEDLVDSGDAVADKKAADRFIARYGESNSWQKGDDGEMVLVIGKDRWPFPIPLEKSEQGWSFDVAAGKEEILDRRIGRNELATIQVCLAYVDAQREYYGENPDSAPLHHYAMKFASSEGERDGLYWPAATGEEPSPLGELVADAREEGYGGHKGGRPYHGYLFKILTAQGGAAKGGAYNYVVRDNLMIGGFGMVAYPARYGNSGVMTFVVNQDGVVYQRDLGPDTATLAEKMTEFNPDSSWKPAEDDGES